MPQQQAFSQNPKDFIVELTSGSTFPATFGAGGNAGVLNATNANVRYPTWVQVVGAGTVIVKNEDDSSTTLVCAGGEIFPGTFKQVTSSTATRVRLGTGRPPPPAPGGVNVQAVNLAGGASSVTGVLPAPSVQAYANDATVHTGAFTVSVGYMHKINPSGATFAYTFPAISSSNDGQKIALVNVSTGTTATVAAPTGSDNIGNSAGTSTGATAAGPTGGAVKTYVADNTQKAWLVGI